MKKLVKRLFILAVVLILLLVGGVILGLYYNNDIVKKGIQDGGTYAMGVPTTVGSVDIGLTSGTFAMTKLQIANPPGYTGPSFVTMGDTKVAVSINSLSQDVIEIPTFSLADIEVTLQRKDGGSNYQVILDNLKKLSSGSTSPAPGEKEKKLIINDLTIKNVRVNVDLGAAPAGAIGDAVNQATKVTIPIDEIKLQNVGKTGTGVSGSGVTVSQLASIIVQAVLNAAAEKGGGLLPTDMLSDLKSRVASIGDLDKLISTQTATEAAAKVGEAAKDAAKKVEEQGKKAVEGAKKGLEGLIPGKKEDKK